MEDTTYLDNFESLLQDGLIKVCQGNGLVGDELLDSPDVTGKWEDYIKDYVADAVENFNDWPQTAIAWAGFLGLGVARNWDRSWEKHSHDSYKDYYGEHGFDDMDEHILHDILGLDLESPEARKISDTLSSCALATLGLIRHEGIEPQTSRGFYILIRAYTVLYRIGAGIELKRLGYKKVAVRV